MIQRKLILSLLVFSFLNSTAQHTISGHLSDSKDSSIVLQDVEVFISELRRTEFSREGGTYIIRNIGIGDFHLQFSKNGYNTEERIVNTKDSATVVNVTMERNNSSPSEISEYGPFMTLPDNQPSSTFYLKRDKLERRGTLNDFQSLNYEPGFNSISTGNDLQLASIRGTSYNELVTIQSGCKNESYLLDTYQNYLPEEGTDGVEVVKGPVSLMYGAGGLGGALIYHDEKLPEAGTAEGDVRFAYFTNTSGINADAGVKAMTQKGIFYSVRLGTKQHGSYVQGEGDSLIKNTENKLYAYNSGFISSTAKATVGIEKNWGKSSMSFHYFDKKDEIIRSLSDSLIEFEDQDVQKQWSVEIPYLRSRALMISSENIFMLKNAQLQINLSWQNEHQNSVDSSEYNFSEAPPKNNAFTADVKYVSDARNKFGYSLGIQGERSKLHRGINHYEESISESAGIYGILRYDISRFNFFAGGRIDAVKYNTYNPNYQNINLNETEPGWSAGLVYHPANHISIKGNIGAGFSTPTQMYAVENNIEEDAAVIFNYPSFIISAELFNNHINNYNSTFLSSTLKQDVNFKGGELSAAIHPLAISFIELKGAYELFGADYDVNSTSDKIINHSKFTGALKFYADHLNYLYHPYICFTFRHYKQDESDIVLYNADNYYYSLLDVSVGGSFKIGSKLMDLTLSITNLIDEQYNYPMFELRGLQYPVYDIGRNISLQIRVPFKI